MGGANLRSEVQVQLTNLEGLLTYLEERDQFGVKEYLLCQARLHEAIKHLKRLERLADHERNAE